MSSTFFQLLVRKPVNITEINRQISDELKRCLPKGWGIIFKLKDNLKNKTPDNSDISNYEWIVSDFSDSSKYDIAYIFNEDLKKPLSSRRYSEMPIEHYILSISIDSELFILSVNQNINKDPRNSPTYSLSRVKKGYICSIDDNAISRIIREALNEKEQSVIKIGNYKIL